MLFAGVLTSTFGVCHEASRWFASEDGHMLRDHDQLRSHVVRDRPLHDSPAVAVNDDGEVAPADRRAQVGDILSPCLVRGRRREVPRDDVIGDWELMRWVGRCLESSRARAGKAVLSRDPRDPLASDTFAFRNQLAVDARAPVGHQPLLVNRLDVRSQTPARPGTDGLVVDRPSIESRR
ncbi:MAG: hypothetical protein ACJAYU_003435 [Bradymonadia bacterium]